MNVVRQAVTAAIKAVTAGSLEADVVPLVDVVRQRMLLAKLGGLEIRYMLAIVL